MIVISFVSNDLIKMTFEYKHHAPLFSLDLLFSCPIIIPWVQKHVFHKVLTPLRFYKAPVKPSLNILACICFQYSQWLHIALYQAYIHGLVHSLSYLTFTLNLEKEFLVIA